MQECGEPGHSTLNGWATLNGSSGKQWCGSAFGRGKNSDAIGKDPDQGRAECSWAALKTARWVGVGAPLMVSGRAQHQFRYSPDTVMAREFTRVFWSCLHTQPFARQKLLQSIHILKSSGFMMSLGAIHLGVVCLSCSVEENWFAFPGTDFCEVFQSSCQLPQAACLPACCLTVSPRAVGAGFASVCCVLVCHRLATVSIDVLISMPLVKCDTW